jgi:hypothetical protein
MTNPFGPNPFEGNPFGAGPPGPPFAPPPAPPVPPRHEANTLATLSVVFAFVFAPAGAILGHLGLSQIRRTGERGRDRALVGLTLSYVFIAAAVVALAVTAVPPSTTTTRTTTTTTPPTVAPADVDGLLPSLDDVKNFAGDPDLTLDSTYHQPVSNPQRLTIDRSECRTTFEVGALEVYDSARTIRFSELDFGDITHGLYNRWDIGAAVASFGDASAAQAQLAKLQSIWRQCGGSTINQTFTNGETYPVSVKPPEDAGNGITTLMRLPQAPIPIFCVRAIVVKANVFVDVGVATTTSSDRSRQVALAMASYILGEIPG